MIVRLVRGPSDAAMFRALLIEYNEALPAELRHDVRAGLLTPRDDGGDSAAIVALVDGAGAGCLALSRLDSTTVLMKRLYVRPQHRRSGLARAIVAEGLAWSRSGGYERVVLDTHEELLAVAFNFYRSLGFEPCDAYGEVEYASPTFLALRL